MGAALVVGVAAASANGLRATARLSGRTTIPVTDAQQFEAAIGTAQPGDTIQLGDGTYAGLSVSRQFASTVTITGSRGVELAGIAFLKSSNVTLSGVTIAPSAGARVAVEIKYSSKITLDKVLVDGRTESAGAWVSTDRSDSNITISNSELTDCGNGNRCINADADGLELVNDDFHDCLDCDFVRGGGANVVLRGNTFDRAIPGSCQGGSASCNHNDHVQIMGGGPWTIVGNRFGDRGGGAASIFVSTAVGNTANPIHDVLVASNLLMGSSTGYFGVEIAAQGAAGAPQRVSVVNNTILSGSISALRFGPRWAQVDPAQRPIVANNILGISNGSDCHVRTSANVVERGPACPGDLQGSAHLDANGAPTKESRLVIGHADPAYVPQTDFFGHARNSPPDIGAIDYALPPLGLTAPGRVTMSRAALRKHGWQVTVKVGLNGVLTLRTRLLEGQAQLFLVRTNVRGEDGRAVSLVLPPRARGAAQLVLEFRALAPDGRTLTRTTTLVLRP